MHAIVTRRYLLENIGCNYLDHFGKWNTDFANHSYARIRELHSGVVVANISQTIEYAFMYVDIGAIVQSS